MKEEYAQIVTMVDIYASNTTTESLIHGMQLYYSDVTVNGTL